MKLMHELLEVSRLWQVEKLCSHFLFVQKIGLRTEKDGYILFSLYLINKIMFLFHV